MKKAIVIGITMILGLGFTALAGPLSGSWASSLVVDPAASSFTSLTSTLAVDYTVSGWTFGSSSSFTLTGFSSQSFTAGGSFGAFTLSSTMVFDPMAVTEKIYTAFWAAQDYPLIRLIIKRIPAATICPITYTTVTEPKFLTWKTEGSISIGGVELGVLFYIDQSHYQVKLTDYATRLTKLTSEVLSGDTYVCDTGINGSGWRFSVAGAIGDITATSYTYFNLTETDLSSLSTAYCPTVGKSGTLSIYADDCAPAFTEEYVLLEGISLGCATIDAGLSITCDGFNYVAFVVSDVAIGEWLELDFGLTFTTTAKATDFCLTATMPESDCLTIEFGLNDSADPDTTGSIDSINFYGIGFVYAWDAITFTSYTELSANSALFSTAGAYDYLNSNTTNSYLVPYLGRTNECTEDATYYRRVFEGRYRELKCVYTERYRLWEKFIIDIDGDACCGGALDLTISTWFGDHEELAWYAFYVYPKATAKTPTIEDWRLTWLLGDAEADGFVIADEFPEVDATKYEDAQGVVTSTGYRAGTQTTLFSWAKTEVDASVGVASNITLDLGFNVSAFGWESLEVGFTFEF